MNKLITVSYACPICRMPVRTVSVPRREPATTSITAWLESTIRLLSDDHLTRSPACPATELHDLKIPTEGIAWIDTFPIRRGES